MPKKWVAVGCGFFEVDVAHDDVVVAAGCSACSWQPIHGGSLDDPAERAYVVRDVRELDRTDVLTSSAPRHDLVEVDLRGSWHRRSGG